MVRVLICFIALVGACQCQEEAELPVRAPAQRAAETPPTSPVVPPVVEEPAPPPPGPRLEAPRYTIEAKVAGNRYTLGRPGELTVEMQLADTYAFSAEGALLVRIRAPQGVGVTRSELTRADAARVTSTSARFEVPFRPTQRGEANVDAFVSFVLCQGPDKCETRNEQVTLGITIE